jgi:ADP-ribose pyrophosphatase YjhB (NUDIX family)
MSIRTYYYCPLCGTRLEERFAFDQIRSVCPACGFVHFDDPKVAVIGLVMWQKHVLLIQRGVNPMKGKWALPGGYMDAGEMPLGALMRELREEVGLTIGEGELLEIFPMAGPGVFNRGIVIAYRAVVESIDAPLLACDDDVCEAGWFLVDQLPDELAFESTHTLLARWRAEQSGQPPSGTVDHTYNEE